MAGGTSSAESNWHMDLRARASPIYLLSTSLQLLQVPGCGFLLLMGLLHGHPISFPLDLLLSRL